ncbi:hypothetical protein K443DRAFT_471088 [Laccaria amethystina LaAM-08-1]|uniref:Autophagy-related protein n=1 Tax=Laccaria amethystina LaAM-08-1 TaxID=1095629 RepID=A0A0C9WHT5_9AGAR|nr:hypothetical protein K443DRAFT_471088 [Laccaria amethystina LaAM-08-1]
MLFLRRNTNNTASSAYKKKLHGWLSYAFASEVFVIVSLTLFLPICLEQFARDNGYLLPLRTERCSAVQAATTTRMTMTMDARTPSSDATGRCVVWIAGVWIDTASFSLYVYSISVALQAITVISMGGIADHPPHRKTLLLSFASLGSLASTLFLLLPSSSPLWHLSALLAICANIGFGASVVAMNAYLPGLAREAPEVVGILEEESAQDEQRGSEGEDRDVNADPSSPLIPRPHSPFSSSSHPAHSDVKARYDAALSRTTSRISSLGIALGYGAGIFLLLVALVPVTLMRGSTFALRVAIGLSGVWWGLFSVPAWLWLPSSSSASGAGAGGEEGVWDEGEGEGTKVHWDVKREIGAAWVRLGDMLRWREVKKLRNTFKYLAAWFLLSDGFTTITSTAILFGKTSLSMSPSALILIGVLTPLSGILGSLLWPKFQARMGWTNLRVLVTLVVLASLIPAYGCLGFVFQGRTRFGGLTTQGEMFGLAVVFGSVYGAFQGYARAFYAELLPPGEEARWYGLFSITDKSSSFLGPLVVGLIADMTGNIRYAFFFLVVMIWLAVPVLMSVDVQRGREDARAYDYRGSREARMGGGL